MLKQSTIFLRNSTVAIGLLLFVVFLQLIPTNLTYAAPTDLQFTGVGSVNVPNSGTPLAFPASYGSAANGPATYNIAGEGVTITGGTPDGYNTADAYTSQTQETAAITLGNEVSDLLYTFVITVFGQLFSWGGWLFDIGLNDFLLGFGNQYYNRNVGVGVEETWKVVRDLFNLTFIFGLVYIGFKMILDAADSSARKMLVSLIGAALLVNFSLFIIKFIIDISNVTAGVIASAFQGEIDGKLSIANGFINIINFSTMLKVTQADMTAYSTTGGYAYIFGIMIFLAVAAFVFAAGGILLIIRFIVLNIYLVFSPIMFLGWVFPSLNRHSQKYMSGFLGQAFFAPAYILMLYLSFKVLSKYATISELDYGALFAANKDTSTLGDATLAIPFFVMAMVFLVASLVVAKNMGAVGAGTAISIGNKLRGHTQSFIGRNTVGRPASWMAKQQDTRGGRIAGGIMTAATLGAFDNRAQRNLWEAGKKAKFGGSYSRSDDKEYNEKVSSLVSIANTKASNKKTITDGQEALTVPEEQRTDAQKDAIYKMQSVVASMSTSQIEAMADKDRASVASAFTSSQVENLMKSDKIGIDDKAAIGKARKEAMEKLVTKNGELLSSELTKLTIDQIEDAGADFIKKYSDLFSSAQVDDIKKSKKLSPSLKSNFLSERGKSQKAAVSSFDTANKVFNTYNGNNQYKRRKSADIAGLGVDVLLSDNAVHYLQIGDLEAIGDKKTLEKSDRDKLKQNIEAEAQNNNKNAKELLGWINSAQGQRLNW